MPRKPKNISSSIRDSEERAISGAEIGSDPKQNEGISDAKDDQAKFHLRRLIRRISREVRRDNITYRQLKYVFLKVRKKCGLEAPTKPKNLKELPTEDEIAAFFAAIKNPVHRLIFDVLLGTGLRVSELCQLEVKRVDLGGNTLFVYKGKGKKDRVVVFGNRLKEALALYLEGKRQTFLFQSNRDTAYSSRRIQQLCDKYRALGHIDKKITPHLFRHIWNTRMAMAGVPEERRAILAGHEQGSGIQKVYTHLSAGGFKDEIIAILDKEKR